MIEGTWFNTDERYSEPDKFRQNAMNLRVQLYNVKKEICLYSSHKVFENWLIQCIMIHMGRHDIMGSGNQNDRPPYCYISNFNDDV